MKNRKFWIIIIVLFMLLCAVSAYLIIRSSKNKTAVRDDTVEEGYAEDQYEASVTLEEDQTMEAYSEETGEVSGSGTPVHASIETESISAEADTETSTDADSSSDFALPEIEITNEVPDIDEADFTEPETSSGSNPVSETDANGIRIHENGDIELPELP